MSKARKKISQQTRVAILTEAGWRCAVPTCRNILALDLHHLDPVSNRGGDTASNLVALCPTCHGLHHRGEIPQEALYTYKAILISLGHAFDVATIDQLLFLDALSGRPLQLQGHGVVIFMRLIAAGLASFESTGRDMSIEFYRVDLTPRGQALVGAWKSGNRERVAHVLSTGVA